MFDLEKTLNDDGADRQDDSAKTDNRLRSILATPLFLIVAVVFDICLIVGQKLDSLIRWKKGEDAEPRG